MPSEGRYMGGRDGAPRRPLHRSRIRHRSPAPDLVAAPARPAEQGFGPRHRLRLSLRRPCAGSFPEARPTIPILRRGEPRLHMSGDLKAGGGNALRRSSATPTSRSCRRATGTGGSSRRRHLQTGKGCCRDSEGPTRSPCWFIDHGLFGRELSSGRRISLGADIPYKQPKATLKGGYRRRALGEPERRRSRGRSPMPNIWPHCPVKVHQSPWR